MLASRGVRGEVVCDITTDFPERFRRTRSVYLGTPPQGHAVQDARVRGSRVYLKLAGIDSREDADRRRGWWVLVPESEAEPLPEGQYYWHQLVGLRVITVEGAELGTISDIIQTGSNDVYVVASEHGEILLPAIRDVIRSTNPESGIMTVDPLPGLVPDS